MRRPRRRRQLVGGGGSEHDRRRSRRRASPSTRPTASTYQPTQGVTDDTIKIGSSFPQSGTYSAFAKISKGYQAYFKYVNAQGRGERSPDRGHHQGRRVRPGQDQAERPASWCRATACSACSTWSARRTTWPIRDDLGEQCIPNLYVATGSQLWGETDAYPWLIGSIPSYATEAAIFADYLKANKPTAKVAILAQNDDFGEGYVDAFKKAIEGTDITVVDEQTYNPTDPDVKSQITTLLGLGADTALLGTTGAEVPPGAQRHARSRVGTRRSTSRRRARRRRSSAWLTGANNGVISSIYLKDPADPQWADDAAMQEFQTLGAQNGITAEDLQNGIVGYGWTMGALLVETFKQAPRADPRNR